jgi:sterol desaturase/sphingolipid hydroxylase (fatty acid hydroxylase superfamily)
MYDNKGKLGFAATIKRISCVTGDIAQAVSKSSINYWASYVTDLACPLLFAYLGTRRHWGWASAVVSFSSGLAVFSLIEYSIHRWLLHVPGNLLSDLHGAHHKNPEKHSAFFFPTSIVTSTSLWLLLNRALHFQVASFLICGVASGYCYFGILHHIEHTTRINRIPFRWLQKRWAAHSVHHRFDHRNFGVVTSVWDRMLGTHQSSKKRKHLRV